MINFLDYIQAHADFPKPEVVFWDFSKLLADQKAFPAAIEAIRNHFQNQKITHIAAIEAKGFTLGGALAYCMKLPLHLIRKPGLVPGSVNKSHFIKEYGEGEYHLSSQTFKAFDRVLVVYDIMAGAGATKAAIQLIEAQGGNVAGCAYVIELEYLKGRAQLDDYNVFSLVKIKERRNASFF